MVRVLVADDDPLAARQVAEVVGEEVPHEVEVATSAAAARALAAAGRFDAAVIGFRLGGAAEGAELAAALRVVDPHLPVIVTTAPADADGTERALAAFGWLHHVARPVVAAELLPRLEAALERARLERRMARLERELDHRERALTSTSRSLCPSSARTSSTRATPPCCAIAPPAACPTTSPSPTGPRPNHDFRPRPRKRHS